MTTKPIFIYSQVEVAHALSKEQSSFHAGMQESSRFDRLFAAVFDSMKMQDVVGNTELSNMLNTIAYISNNHGS